MMAVTFPNYKTSSESLYLPRCHNMILKTYVLFIWININFFI